MSEKTFSNDDVAKHNTAEDLYVSIEGKVYDVTSYAQDHPGGADVLLNSAGQDATEGFNDIGHSTDAKEQLKQYLVGKLEASAVAETSQPSTSKPAVPASKKPRKPSSGTRWIIAVVIAALLLILLSNVNIELQW